MVPFAGYEMPIQYSGIIDEHLAVRSKAGLFDVSHMGEIFVRGPHATDFVQHLVTNDVTRLYDGRAMYTVMCREDGGIIDDLLVYRLSEHEYMLVVNAANREKDLDWMIQNNPHKAEIEDLSETIGLIAVQGPSSPEIVERVLGIRIDDLKFYHFRSLSSEAALHLPLLSRTGYTGEPGIELYCDASETGELWDRLLEAGEESGLKPAGLGARDTLRIEAGYCLYGNEITDETNPFEAGLGWLVRLDSDDFIGKSALQTIKEAGLDRKLVGFVLNERGIPRNGYAILDPHGKEIGTVTSGTQSPVLNAGIGLGYVHNDEAFTRPGSPIEIAVRGRSMRAVVKQPPLHQT